MRERARPDSNPEIEMSEDAKMSNDGTGMAPTPQGEDLSRVIVRRRGDDRHISARIQSSNEEVARRRGDFLIKREKGKITIAVG